MKIKIVFSLLLVSLVVGGLYFVPSVSAQSADTTPANSGLIQQLMQMIATLQKQIMAILQQRGPAPTPTTSPVPAGWQTYRNDQYGFEFQYDNDHYTKPGDFQYRQSIVVVFNKANDPCAKCDLRSSLEVRLQPANMTIGSFLSGGYFNNDSKKYQSYSTINLNGSTAYVIKYLVTDALVDNAPREIILVPGVKFSFLLDYFGGDSKTIVNTFKITNITQNTGWQTYRNAQYGFEVMIPSNWIAKVYSDPTYIKNNLSTGITFSVPQFPNSTLVSISVYASEQWDLGQDAWDRMSGAPRGTYLGRNGKYVFAANHILEVVPGLENEENKISQVISSFKAFNVSSPASSSWQTYSNPQYGFQIQYPVGSSKPGDVDISGGRNISFEISSGGVSFMVEVVKQAWYSGILKSPANCNDFDPNILTSHTTINGIDFVKGDVSGQFSGMQSASDATEYCTIKNGTAYKLIPRISLPSREQVRPDVDRDSTLNQMISTFKFTN